MNRQDLRASVVIAIVWLLGVTTYSIWKGPAVTTDTGGSYHFLEATPVAQTTFSDEQAPKHIKVPIRWAHQRWGAV